ncbi:muscle M-line assembly protein unc-89-like [Telopea speciosissima]|uniref:muscle M-line assembly protein unc-89-like n=1 Tax=Telopea speciosissima TaxID=54955 RepID=UPI001CC7435E|nr:muscle M-line assembly protein unc-89-like [Telopea speciosissima]
MVQRKDPNKLGIQADSKDDVKSDKWSLALKSSAQYQDIQDKGGTQLKKEMKKSRSIKLLDLENLEHTPTRRAKSRFDRPPTSASTAVATPQRPSKFNKRDPSPNYMKPTSSSDSKKDLSQVNPHGYLASCSRMSLSPSPTGRNSHCKSPSPSPSGRNSSRMGPSPYPNGRNSNQESPIPNPSGRNSHGTSLSPSPSGRNSHQKSPSPSSSGRNSSRISLSPSPSGRNSHGTSLSPSPSGRKSNRNSVSPSRGRNSHCQSPSACPSGRNSNHMSPSPNPSGRNSAQNSPRPSPDGRNSDSLSSSPSLRGSYSNTKPCSASDHKPVKTSTKTHSLKPVRTLTKTPSLKGGAELKKQIKKSRAIKLLGLETLESSPMEQTNSGFDESPGIISSAAVTPGNQYLMRTPDLLPNYMKPTSSSDARKEQSQVSTQGSQTSPRKSPNESNLIRIKPSSASDHKPARTLTRTSSLKPVRTLTKTSSLKLQRPSMNIAPCSSLIAGRATCSSTLKDSKFPTFLTLSPGATESEGTSAMKVCPYTYCSLNGHHHAPLPLLKPFLSARRCLLKTQKSLRMKNLSPLQKYPPGKRKGEIDMNRVALNEDSTAQAADLASAAISHVIKEDCIDFFVEIYAKPREDTATSMGRSIYDGHDEATTNCAVNSNISVGITSSVIYGTEIETEYAGKVHESTPNELSYSDKALKTTLTKTATWYRNRYRILHWEGIGRRKHLFKSPALQEELVSKPDETINKDCKEFPLEGLAQVQVHAENAESFTLEYGYDDSGTDVEDQSSGRGIPINFSGERSDIYDLSDPSLFSSTEVACKEPATITEEADGVPKPDEAFNSMVYSASIEEQLDDLTASSYEKNEVPESENLLQEHQLIGVDELIPITEVIDGILVNEQESSLAFSNNLVGVDVGGDAEGKEQAEDAVELDGYGGESSHAENSIGEETMLVEDNMESDATEKINSEDNITSSKKNEKIVNRGNDSNQLHMTSVNLKRTTRCRRPINEQEDERKFNPKEPQFLDIEPEPEPEKVDLRHQMMDGRKNAEEWMLDYALQQAVTQLAPARKRRVSLLVEAFEAVIPSPKCETRLPNTSTAFAHARSIQACN